MKYPEDKIDAYLQGKMTSSEKEAFESEMNRDSAFKEEVNLMRSIICGLSDRQNKLEALEAWQGEAEKGSRSSKRKWMPWVTAYSTAAAVVAGVLLFMPPSAVDYNPMPSTIQEVDSSRGGNISFKGQPDNKEDLDSLEAEIARMESLLKEALRKREEADYDVKKYEYALEQLKKKREMTDSTKF